MGYAIAEYVARTKSQRKRGDLKVTPVAKAVRRLQMMSPP